MRYSILLTLLICSLAVADESPGHHEKTPVQAPAELTAAGAVYGARLPAPMPAAITIDAAAANLAEHAGKMTAFSGRITEVCQKMGCWVILTGENGRFARVSMRDHAFGVPKDSSGAAIVYGTLSVKMLSDEEIEHLKKDGAAATHSTELQIDAVSVLIPKAA